MGRCGISVSDRAGVDACPGWALTRNNTLPQMFWEGLVLYLGQHHEPCMLCCCAPMWLLKHLAAVEIKRRGRGWKAAECYRRECGRAEAVGVPVRWIDVDRRVARGRPRWGGTIILRDEGAELLMVSIFIIARSEESYSTCKYKV